MNRFICCLMLFCMFSCESENNTKDDLSSIEDDQKISNILDIERGLASGTIYRRVGVGIGRYVNPTNISGGQYVVLGREVDESLLDCTGQYTPLGRADDGTPLNYTAGTPNVAIGYQSMTSNTEGLHNVALDTRTFSNSTGLDNVSNRPVLKNTGIGMDWLLRTHTGGGMRVPHGRIDSSLNDTGQTINSTRER